MSSSSSSSYCLHPECSGNACAHLTNWYLEGVNEVNTDNGILYVRLVYFLSTNTQQVEIYKDTSYFYLVAIGQTTSLIPAIITLNERNSSGITGTVNWDATPLNYAYSATLHCIDISSSSSTSSLDSSSTSSLTTQSFSSSSSQCCSTFFCEGAACVSFSSWTFNGLGDSTTTNCNAYIGLELSGTTQQVRIYKDPLLALLVAVGQRSGAGVITFIEQNNSGLTGSVIYDGTLYAYPSLMILSCHELSSSSSSSSSSIDSSSSSSQEYSFSSQSSSQTSSTSSIDSSSSSSSEEYTSSSESTTSNSSNSSSSTSSESSSSSIDSSSTSSESVGNVSSSSSSSFEPWNQIKPLILGLSAAANPSYKNRIAQTIFISESTYSIGKIYCYLYKARGASDNYWIRCSIYDCNNDGSPSSELFQQAIYADTVDHDGWYTFDFNLTDQITPSNNYLAIVMRHNGNENNYVLWGYYFKNEDDNTTAWTSYDDSTWTEFKSAVMAIKVIDNYDPYNLDNFTIITPAPVDTQTATDAITDGKITYQDLICSLVVDSSGSMGLTDRFNNRINFVQRLVNKFQATYPSTILFDFITFGGAELDSENITTNLGQYETINIDLTQPTRNTYTFTVVSVNVSSGAVYEQDGKTFIVQYGLVGDGILICYGTEDPIPSGFLTKVSGTGDTEISYGEFDKTTIDDSFIAYGFKTFQNGHTYNIGDFSVNRSVISSVNLSNWQLFSPSSESPSISLGSNGPSNSSSIDIVATSNLVSRKLFTNKLIISSAVTSIIEVGDTEVTVADSTGFKVFDYIDIVNGAGANLGRQITAITGSKITFNGPATIRMSNYSFSGSIVQTSTWTRTQTFNGNTANILVRDVGVTRNIVFYLQNQNGYFLEWDLRPFSEWVKTNIYWFGSAAILPISLLEKDGTPFPDGTKVELLVNQEPDIIVENQLSSITVTKTSAVGSTKIYVTDSTGYVRESIIDITDKSGNIQTTEIFEIGSDASGDYIIISDPLQFEVNTANGTLISPNVNTNSLLPSDSILSIELPIVDVTPIVNNKSLNPSLLKPYDLAPLPPSTPYEDLNTDQEHIQKQTIDMPTIDGNAVTRVLPLTEDILKTVQEKTEDLNRIQRYSQLISPVSQLEQNEGDVETVVSTITVEETTTTATTTGDYVIETPVFTTNGIATSSMRSFSTDLTEKSFPGVTVPGVPTSSITLLSKDYVIYPSAEVNSDSGSILAKIYLNSFDISFVPPIYIYSSLENNPEISYYIRRRDSGGGCFGNTYARENIRGVYASGDGFTLDYVITDELILANNQTLNVTIYTNRVADLDSLADSVINDKNFRYSAQFVNSILPNTTETDENGDTVVVTNQSRISAWREIVQNNPFQEIINDTGETDSTPQISEEDTGFRNALIQQYLDLVNAELPTTSTNAPDIFYSDPAQWTLAQQYTIYTYTIPIVNGKASLTIPSNDTVSLLMVEASVTFGDENNYEQIRSDLIFVGNPIQVSGVSPYTIIPADNETYEIGVTVEWQDGSIAIEDNTSVNFSLTTNAEPTTSVTDNGWAGGVFVGPHEPIETAEISAADLCPNMEGETVSIEVFHSSGYVRKVNRSIIWYGQINQEDVTDTFVFYAPDASGFSWSDGTQGNSIITSNLNDSLNPTSLFVGEDGVERLQGKGQPNNLPRAVRIINGSPAKTTWQGGTINMRALPFNKSIGYKQVSCGGNAYSEPWDQKINAISSYLMENGTYRMGEIGSGRPYPGPLGQLVVPKPRVQYREPLGITLALEGADSFIRDGLQSPRVIATVTWKGKPITNKFIVNEGTEFETIINYNYPNVTFQSGICGEENSTGGDCAQMKDTRNSIDGCLTVAPHQSCKLTSYAVQTGLLRTNIYISGSNSHTHATIVDEDGNGTTTSTIVLDGTVTDHTHIISNYVAQTSLSHTHTLRCVAITQLKPTLNKETSLVVNAYVIYDPTNCLPYEDEPSNAEGNRMMFSTLRLPAVQEVPKLQLRIEVGNDLSIGTPTFTVDYDTVGSSSAPTFFTALSIDETIRGFDIKADARFSQYTYVNGSGVLVTVPARPVEDGSRITIEFTPYKPTDQEAQTDIGYVVMSAGLKRAYMTLKVKAAIASEGEFASKEFDINIVSITQWYPSVRHETPELTNDNIYIAEAIGSFGFFGASQLHDAVKLAAQKIVEYQTDDSAYKNYKKIMVVVSDGDENTSENSIRQAISNVNFIDGDGEVPVIVVQLGQVHSSDSVLLEKYASETVGSIEYLNNSTITEINSVVNNIVTSNSLMVNEVILTGSITLAENSFSTQTALSGVTVPSGGSVVYRTRSSYNQIDWTEWNDWIDSSISYASTPTDEFKKYLEYEIKISGNFNFETPVINGGVEVSYFNPKSFSVFFQPIQLELNDDEYVSSIHVTHEADIPSTSTVEYLVNQMSSINLEEYITVYPDRYTIIPTRFNELMTTEDYKTYTSVNYGWPKEATIEIWRLGATAQTGVLIDSSEYAFNNVDGTVTFLSAQNATDTIFINVFFEPVMRFALKVTNYGQESAIIHHVAFMYNVSKRIPVTNSGSIIHVPISRRLSS